MAKSFLNAAKVFVSFTRTPVSEPTVRRYAERLGAVLAQSESESAEDSAGPRTDAADAAEAADDQRPFWVGADGVFVRLVGGGWREVRSVSIGRVNPPCVVAGEEQVTTTALSYFSRLTDGAERFLELAASEFQRRGVSAASQVGAGSDGADWCQRLFDRYCPQARRYLDFYHATGRVQVFSQALWDQPATAQWYAGSQLHDLKHQGPARLLASLSAWSQESAPTPVRTVASAQHAYFASREHLLDYPGVRAARLPIGTGNAESANLHVVQDRLKGPGKFWAEEHVNPMLALRNAWCSDRWEEAWTRSSARLAEGHYPIRLFHAPKAKN